MIIDKGVVVVKASALADVIAEEIRKRGPITFCDFMEMALYQPRLGYYASGSERIGRSGDYYTSPAASQVFGQILAAELKRMWQAGGAGRFSVVEMGAGKGRLASDIVRYLLDHDPEFYSHISYRAVERGDVLPEVKSGCFLSNELVDAMPVHRVKGQGARGKLREAYVGLEGGKFVEVWDEVSTPEIGQYFEELKVVLPAGLVAEVNLEAVRWIAEVASRLKRGFVLTIDYGYLSDELYQPYRADGTLLCYYRHTVSEDPFARIGEQDITSHVNFSALVHWGGKAGLEAVEFAEQGRWLIDHGILQRIEQAKRDFSDADYLKRYLPIKNLIMPGAMGDFKVLMQRKR